MSYCDLIYKRLKNIEKKYNNAQVFSIGKSFLGKDIYALRVGNGKKAVFLGAHHGLEYITAEVLTLFAERYFLDIKDRELYFIPILNPDGVDIATGNISKSLKEKLEKMCDLPLSRSWQANARGVDLNHNFDANWQNNSVKKPSNTRYGGVCPESEPETQAIVKFLREILPQILISFHSQGEVIYYDFDSKIPPHSYFLALLFSLASGYKMENPILEASFGGLKDWYIKEFNLPAFTVEVGKGKNPLPLSDAENILLSVAPILRLAVDIGCAMI